MSSLLKVLTSRRALRGLSEKPLDQVAVARLFQAATLAPSCNNKQPWRFVGVQGAPMLEELRRLLTAGNYWAKKAPLLVAAWTHVDYDVKYPDGREFALFDLGQAVMALQIQAQAEGLVSHPMAGFDTAKTASLLGLPEGAIVPVLIAVALPGSDEHLSEKHRDQEHSPRSRKPMEEVGSFR